MRRLTSLMLFAVASPLIMMSTSPTSRAETWAEKLNFPKGSRVVILHADDAGMCHEANRATQRYLVQGLIQSASAMAPCPWFDDFVAWATDQSELDIGLHLTLTSEWKHYRWGPVAPAPEGSGMTDPSGYLWRSAADVAGNATAVAVDREIRAQVERARARGLNPTHLDTHMGVLYARPDYAAAYLDLAEELNIPAMVIEMTPPVIAHYRKEGYPLTDAMIERIHAYKLPKLDSFVSVPKGKTYEQVRDAFAKQIRSLRPGITEIVFHPSMPSDALQRITNSWQQRTWESQLLADPVIQELFQTEELQFTDWREMMRRHEASQAAPVN